MAETVGQRSQSVYIGWPGRVEKVDPRGVAGLPVGKTSITGIYRRRSGTSHAPEAGVRCRRPNALWPPLLLSTMHAYTCVLWWGGAKRCPTGRCPGPATCINKR